MFLTKSTGQDVNEFTDTVLPRMFHHSNFASFVRQLNKYNFRKVGRVIPPLQRSPHVHICITKQLRKYDGVLEVERVSSTPS